MVTEEASTTRCRVAPAQTNPRRRDGDPRRLGLPHYDEHYAPTLPEREKHVRLIVREGLKVEVTPRRVECSGEGIRRRVHGCTSLEEPARANGPDHREDSPWNGSPHSKTTQHIPDPLEEEEEKDEFIQAEEESN